MRAKAKSSSTPYPIWVEGEYITEPPIRPSDGAVRPAGHYIDKGGYPGANVYEVDINTMCRQTDAADRFGKPIYEQDILLYETAEEIGYFIVQDLETTVDIVNGEIIEVGDLDTENIKNIGSMEAIENNLSQEFKDELEKGNINISTAHELSRLDKDGQKQAYEKYEEKGELHISDVKEEPKTEITDEQAEQVQKAIKEALKGEVNRAVFKVKGNVAAVEKELVKHFSKTFTAKTLELNGKEFIYRFQTEGMAIQIKEDWSTYIIEYSDLAEIVALMIETEELAYDDSTEEAPQGPAEEEDAEGTQESGFMNEPEETQEDEEENDNLPGQQDMSDYPEYVPEPQEKGLSFTEWISKKYGTGQYNMIQKEVRKVIMTESENGNICPAEWENRLTNALSVWVMSKTAEYQKYLQG